MITALIALVSLLIGMLLGFYGRQLLDKVVYLYSYWEEKRDRHEAGVVKPSVSRNTRTLPQIVDLTSESGGVMKPKPDVNAMRNIKEREARIRARTP